MSKLSAFVRGVAFRDPDLPVEQVATVLHAAIRGIVWETEEAENRALVKLAALAVAFWRETRKVLSGKIELDLRDEAVLDAVVAYLRAGGDS